MLRAEENSETSGHGSVVQKRSGNSSSISEERFGTGSQERTQHEDKAQRCSILQQRRYHGSTATVLWGRRVVVNKKKTQGTAREEVSVKMD